MSTLSEETLALSVDEVSMQDWLAAVTTFKFAPPSTYSAARFEPHPEPARQVPTRRLTATVQRRDPSIPTALAGARTAYWLALAAAVGLLALL